MNVAFPALLIFLLVLPGFIFNLTFYQTENVRIKYIPITHKAILCSAIAVLLHALWLWITVYWLGYHVNVNTVLILISGIESSKLFSVVSTITTHQIFVATVYLFSLYIASYTIGVLLRWCLRYCKLEKFSFFRIESPWYYLFTGHDWNDGQPDGVRIAAILEIANKGYLYIGWLDKFYLDSSGNIERLVLTGAMRRELEKDKIKEESESLHNRFYPIDGHYFVLKYSDVKSLNVQFLKLELKK